MCLRKVRKSLRILRLRRFYLPCFCPFSPHLHGIFVFNGQSCTILGCIEENPGDCNEYNSQGHRILPVCQER